MVFGSEVRGKDTKRKEKYETEEEETNKPFKCYIYIYLLNKQEIIYHYDTKEERNRIFYDLVEDDDECWIYIGDHLIPIKQILYIEKKDSLA